MFTDKEYLVEIKVKNNNLARLIKNRKIKSVAELSRQSRVAIGTLHDILNLKRGAFLKSNKISEQVQNLAAFFNVLPEDLFPDNNFITPLEKNKTAFEISFDEIENVLVDHSNPEALMIEHEEGREKSSALLDAIASLKPRERQVLEQRFIKKNDVH